MKITRKKAFTLLAISSVLIAGLLWARWRPAQRFEFSKKENGTLRVVTWNVGYFTFIKNKNMRDTDLREVTSILKKASPDIVVLQELNNLEQPENLSG